MAYNVITNPADTPVATVEAWVNKYKEQQIEVSHDQSMMNLVTPDDSILVVGPPRLSTPNAKDFHIVGLVNTISYNESAQVQPMKAIGSRRHIFSRTNAPVSGNIGRMITLGPNLYKALYSLTDTENIVGANSKFAKGTDASTIEKQAWYANLEEDLFRLPFGLGIVYMAPTTENAGGKKAVGADYIEMVSLQNRSVALQSGQSFIMEQVTFMADRVVPWDTYTSELSWDESNPAKELIG